LDIAKFLHHKDDVFLAIPASEEAAVVDRILKLEQDIKSKESEDQVRPLDYPRALSVPAFDLSAAKTLALYMRIQNQCVPRQLLVKVRTQREIVRPGANLT
jgi:hypothetical protein